MAGVAQPAAVDTTAADVDTTGADDNTADVDGAAADDNAADVNAAAADDDTADVPAAAADVEADTSDDLAPVPDHIHVGMGSVAADRPAAPKAAFLQPSPKPPPKASFLEWCFMLF